jgi:uncharacterized membrane protein
MTSTLRYLQLLAITVWVGGLVFFAFILAPTAFGVLPTIHLAGSIVGECLKHFDLLALVCGAIFLAVTAELYRRAPNRIRGRYEAEFLLAGAMLLATAYLHWNIIPAMDADQLTANGDINSLPATNPAHTHFDKLHKRSERVAGGVLFVGLAVLFFVSREHSLVTEPSA